MAIRHTFSSPKADGADATLVRPSDWNASHDDGGLAAAIDVVSNVASNAVSIANAASNAASVVSQALSVETVNRTSADNALSVAIAVVSVFTDQLDLADADATSQPWETLVAGTNITFTELAEGNAIQIDATAGSGSVTSTELSAVSAQAASAINVVSNALSVLSQATSVADAALSVRIDVVSAAVVSGADSGLVEADGTSQPWEKVLAGGGIAVTELADGHAIQLDVSVTSTELSAVSAQAASAINVVSNAVSVVSQALSVETAARVAAVDTVSNVASNATSIANAASNAASIVSQALSVETAARVAAVDTVSNVASNAISIANAASNAASIVSQALSVEIVDRVSADNLLSNAISVVSAFALQVDLAEGAITNHIWEQVHAGTNITFTESDESGAIIINATPGSGSVTSTELSAVSAQAASAIAVVSNAVSNLTSIHDVLSNLVSNALSAGDTLSTELSALNATGVDGSQTGQPWDWLLAGTNVTFTELADGHALQIDAAAGAGSATSNELSIVSAQAASAINVVSVAVSNLTSLHNGLSNIVSDALSAGAVINATMVDGIETSQPWDWLVAGTNVTFTELAEGNAIQIDATAGSGSVTSAELQVVSAQAASIANVVSNALSVETAARVLAVDTVSNVASNATSIANAASNAASIVSQALSVEIANRVSADNALSVLIDAVSNAASVVSVYLDQVALEDASLAAQPWDFLVAGTNVTFTELADGHALQIDATAGAGSVTSAELQVVSAQAASIANVVSNAVSVEIIDRISADNALSARIDTASQSISVISQQVSVMSTAVSAISAELTAEISDSQLRDGILSVRINSVGLSVSVLSVYVDEVALEDAAQAAQPWDFILAGTNITLTEVADGHALVIDAAAGTASATSNELSIVSAQAASAINVVSNAVSVVSQALSVETAARVAAVDTVSNAASNAASIANAAANAASIVSQALSVETAARVAAVDTVSNAVSALEVRVSALSAAGPGGGSVTSAELEKATLVDGDATQQIWETVIAGDNITLTELGDGGGHAVKLDVTGPQTRVVAGDQGISVTQQTNISGMSVSVVAGGIYRLDAMVLVNRGAGAAVAKMGLTFPAMKTARGYIKYTLSSPNGLPGTTTEVVSSQGFFALIEGDSASGSIIVSALNTVGAVVSNLAVYQGLFVVSTSGTIQLQAGASTSAGTGLTILAGSYMQVFRIA